MSPVTLRPRPTGPGESRLAARVDALAARVRGPELRWLSARVPEGPLEGMGAALARAMRELAAERSDLDRRADALRATVGLHPVRIRATLEAHLRAFVTNPVALAQDLAALDRDLDADALRERYAAGLEQAGARLEVALQVIAGLVCEASVDDALQLWGSVGDEVVAVAVDDPRRATRLGAVRALGTCLGRLLPADASLPGSGLRTLQRLARDPDEDPWVRRAALGVVLGLDAPIQLAWLQRALSETHGREPFLVRARAVELLCAAAPPGWVEVVRSAVTDPSELVRFTLAEGLGLRLTDPLASALLVELATRHPEPRTRARATATLGAAGRIDVVPTAFLDQPVVAIHALDAALAATAPLPTAVVEALERRQGMEPPALARRATLALHTARVRLGPAFSLAASLGALERGQSRTLRLPEGVTVEALADALVPFAADGFGFSLDVRRFGRVRVTRGDRLVASAWRILHEVRHPAPTKRQTLSQALGRADLGAVRIPPHKLAEESSTGVPGQRHWAEVEGGWAPELPMVDDYLHATLRGRVEVVTPHGHTVVMPPSNPLRRLWARLRTTLSYGALDEARTAAVTDPELRRRYLETFEGMGYRTTGPARAYVDPIAFVLSTRANTLPHVALVVALLAVLHFGRIAWVRMRLKAARRRIPLVLGGWGTRGKSGTERLKAAVVEALGIPYLSKTTGCEAMVLHAPPGGRAMELFLFRPFDKATIWEQANVVQLADALGARSVLWECMALNPLYVDLLQSRWMEDDLSTLTNAYPDHEDIQGPTGMDVAEVIGGFAPHHATVLTTEDNMLPVLQARATEREGTLVQVSRADRTLVAADLMARMPHTEHPANVGLAAAAAAALGVPKVEAIGWMADHVLPDLGALSITPPATHLDRTVTFANGMSANDTLSFLHNWRTCGFRDHDHLAEPATFLVTVVNNRADRVARSRVFAGVLAEHANAHRHVLIGTNTRGLLGYLQEALEARTRATVLDTPERVDALFAHLRPVHPGALGARCAAQLGASAALQGAWQDAVRALPVPAGDPEGAAALAQGLTEAARRLERGTGRETGLAEHLVTAAAGWLRWQAARTARPEVAAAAFVTQALANVVVLSDSGISGDRIQAAAIAACPPGSTVRIMGVQNIKGTGLDFAYQWVFWRQAHRAMVRLGSTNLVDQRAALVALEDNPFGSVLSCDEVLRTLAALDPDPSLRARVEALVAKLTERRDGLLAARRSGGPAKGNPVVAWFRRQLERILDPFDAIRRRRRADVVFADLVAQRISHPRAQEHLAALTARQAGGWLGRR